MAVSNRAVFTQTPKITPVVLANADAANSKKTLHTAGADGSKITQVIATSTDTSARLANLWLTRSAVSYLLATVNIPAGAGTDGVLPTVNLLGASLFPLPVDNDGQPYLFMESGDTLQLSLTTQVTSAKNVYGFAQGANF